MKTEDDLRLRIEELERRSEKVRTLPYTLLFVVAVLVVVCFEQYLINDHLNQKTKSRTEVIRVEVE